MAPQPAQHHFYGACGLLCDPPVTPGVEPPGLRPLAASTALACGLHAFPRVVPGLLVVFLLSSGTSW